MTARNIKDAWKMVDEIFPTDYQKDETASERAGYPIYRSTAEGVDAWISDLGRTLEINLDNGKTIRVNIEDEEVISETTGQVIKDRENANWSGIYSELVKEAGKCRFFASDIIIDIESMERDIQNLVKSGYNAHLERMFGFRESGVDHDAFIESRGIDSPEYRTVWKIFVDIERTHDTITAKLVKIR
jgi:hypothetical protein